MQMVHWNGVAWIMGQHYLLPEAFSVYMCNKGNTFITHVELEQLIMVAMQSHFPHLVSKKLTGWPQFQKKKSKTTSKSKTMTFPVTWDDVYMLALTLRTGKTLETDGCTLKFLIGKTQRIFSVLKLKHDVWTACKYFHNCIPSISRNYI